MFFSSDIKHHEKIAALIDTKTNLRTIVAIHDTTLGPALGGTRMWNYHSTEEALYDVLRLSQGMTCKASVAGLNLGGGKAVIIGDPHKDKSEALFKEYGKFVDGLKGIYITAEDVGTTVEDMEIVRKETKYVTGIDQKHGGSGDPSVYTALGVYVGMKAGWKELTGSDSLVGKSVAVQGAGNVARYLCDHLAKENVKIYITDIYEEKAKSIAEKTGAVCVSPDAIYDLDVDIFSPNALGAILNDQTIPRLKAKLIAGGANNQLADENVHGKLLKDRGILYSPDFVINAGGLINVASEVEGYSKTEVQKRTENIYYTLQKVFFISKQKNISPSIAAYHLAAERVPKLKSQFSDLA